VPDRCQVSDEPEVAHLSVRQADRERRQRTLLDDGVAAALDTLFATVGTGLDVHVLVVATYGDPYAGDPQHPAGGQSVPLQARFASLRDGDPVTEQQRQYLALEGVRSVSPRLSNGLAVALAILDMLDELQTRADDGDQDAARRHEILLAALERDAAPSISENAEFANPESER
jgi:hypothetical protein